MVARVWSIIPSHCEPFRVEGLGHQGNSVVRVSTRSRHTNMYGPNTTHMCGVGVVCVCVCVHIVRWLDLTSNAKMGASNRHVVDYVHVV